VSLDVYLEVDGSTVYSANITHNLGRMASEAVIYYALWRPDEMLDPQAADVIRKLEDEKRWDDAREVRKLLPTPLAAHLIEPLRAGLALLESDPQRFKSFNSPNGWGIYEHFVPFVRKYLDACIEHPTATVSVSR